VSPAPGFLHQSVLARLSFALDLPLRDYPTGRVLWNLGITFDELNVVIPDLIFVTNERLRQTLLNDRLSAAPEIVVEVISPGKEDARRDRIVKRNLYSTRGVSEYWIIDTEARTVEVSRKRKEGGLKRAVVLQAEDELTSPVLPGFTLKVARLFE
jgi:Uma2 family endonuclease